MAYNKFDDLFREIPVTAEQRANPVFNSMLNLRKNLLLNKVKAQRDENLCGAAGVVYLSSSREYDRLTDTVKSLRNEYGDDVFHQIIAYLSDYIVKKSVPENVEFLKELPGYNLNAIKNVCKMALSYMKKGHNISFKDAMFRFMSWTIAVPYSTCEYSRLTNKSTDYLISLGKASVDMVDAFATHCRERASLFYKGHLEEVIAFMYNGEQNIIYYGYKDGLFYMTRYTAHTGLGLMFHDLEEFDGVEYNESPAEYEWKKRMVEDRSDLPFDILSFVVNLWAARETKAFESCYEPAETRSCMAALCPNTKAKFNTYRYVKITPEGESLYEESQRIVNRAKKDSEYRKSLWYTKAYYAHRGIEKVLTYCKASIHHRKCAPVTSESNVVTVYT